MMHEELIKRLREIHPEEFGNQWDFAYACQQLMHEAADVLASENIETVQNEAWSIEVGIQLLNGYMEQLAKRAIETQDEFLIEWCKHLCIIVETEED